MTSQDQTRLRRGRERAADGVILLREGSGPDGDGSEAKIYETLKAAPDVSLGVDALVADAATWHERVHLDPSRANLLRPLALPARARVLEVGASCGVVTRYLGESGFMVDALEVTPSRARVARERCRDLSLVEVFVGDVSDVPSHEEYDLVIVTDLADHHDGIGQPDGYLAFLQACADRLSPKGSLILATANKLGVKYLVGAPSNPTMRGAGATESGPSSGSTRVLSRVELEALLERVGLVPQTLAAFPDHLFTRMMASPSSLPKAFRHLLYHIPDFPSPDPVSPRPRLTDEGLMWESLVEAGLAVDTANSFVVLAGKGRKSSLWPRGLAASYLSLGRRSIWSTVTRVHVSGESARFESKRLYPGRDEPPIRLREYSEPALLGTDLVAFCRDASDEAVERILQRWSEVVEQRKSAGDEISLDLVPHNVILQSDGTLAVFDEEWMIEPGSFIDFGHVRRRGLFWLAARVCQQAAQERPRPQETVRELAIHYGTMIDLPEDGSWLDRTLEIEARFQALVYPRPSNLTQNEWRKRFLKMLRSVMEAPSSPGTPGSLDLDDLAQLRLNLGSIEPRLLGPGLSPRNDDLALLVGLRVYSRIARFLLAPGSRRNRLANRIASHLFRLK